MMEDTEITRRLVLKIENVYHDERGVLKLIPKNKAIMKTQILYNECMDAGKKSFNNKEYSKAEGWYTRSIAFASDKIGKEIGSAYLRRARVNDTVGRLIDSLLDIDRVLEGSLVTDDVLSKVLTVRTNCLERMRANKQYVNYEGRETDPIVDATNNTDDDEGDKEFSDRCNFKNPLIPCTSSKIKLEYDDGKWGRHIVATEDIEPGEILSSQKFWATQFFEQDETTLMFQYCSYCYAECHALIPCPSCCTQMYCSTRCEEQAKELYHDLECKLLVYQTKEPSFTEDGRFRTGRVVKPVILKAQRILLIGTKQGTELKNLMKKLGMSAVFVQNFDLKNEQYMNEYLAVLRMCRTFDIGILTKDVIKGILHVIVALRHVKYFGNADDDKRAKKNIKKDSVSKSELFTALLLANHVMTFATLNEIDFTHFLDGRSLYEASSERIVGRGVVALHNYINHSCDPNINSIIRRRERVIFAVRTIKKGEQIFDSYCGIFTDQFLENRQLLLRRFDFVCQCDACLFKWPTADIAESEEKTFLRDCKKGTIRHQPIFCYQLEYYCRKMLSILHLAIELKCVLLEIYSEPQLCNTVQTKFKILQIFIKIRIWFDNDGVPIELKKPLMLVMECEKNITVLMKLLFEDSYRKCTNMPPVVDIKYRIRQFSIWLDKYILNFLSLHQVKYSNINLFV